MNRSILVLLLFMIALGPTAQSGECNRRGCTPRDDPQTLEYAKSRLEIIVNGYFDQMMISKNLSASEMEDRHNTIVSWARANADQSSNYFMDGWEAELRMKLQILSVEDPQFSTNVPTVVRSAVENYYQKKIESLRNLQ